MAALWAEFNAILRLIRTFKAVNEDWPHVPSALVLFLPATTFALTLFLPRVLRSYSRVCVCASVRSRKRARYVCTYVHAAAGAALMAQHAKRILLYYH